MITVLMAVYNTPPQQLEQAIGSIISQNQCSAAGEDFEFLIVDDGSSDCSTIDVLRRAEAEYSQVRIAWEPHRGLTASLNRGLELAHGEFIARQDADDWSAPNRMEQQAAALRRDPELVLCGTNAWTHQQNGAALWTTRLPVTDRAIRDAFWRGNPFVHGSTMFRSEAARRIGGYRKEFPCSQDYDFFWRLAEQGKVRNLDEPLYHYRYSDTAVSARRASDQVLAHRAARILALDRLAGRPEDVPAAIGQASRAAGSRKGKLRALLKAADHQMLAGNYARALISYGRLLASHPLSALAWGKLVRWGVFTGFPLVRELCF